MVADAPENHLRGHALVDAVQQLLDKASADFGGEELQRTASLKLSFGGSKPAPGTVWLSEDALAECGDAGEADDAVRFVAAQGFPSCAPVCQRAPGQHERINLVVREAVLAQRVDGLGG